MAVPRRLQELYEIPKLSQKFETAFNQLYDDVGRGMIVDDLHGVELEEFLDFLDEVRHYSHHRGHRFDHSIRYCSLRD